MESQLASNPASSEGVFLSAAKNKYRQLGIDLKFQGDLAITIGILGSLQREIQESFDQVDQQSRISEVLIDQQMQRCLKCAERNHQLLLKVLQVKEELVGRMYMNQLTCRPNEQKLTALLGEIRRAKQEVMEQVRELQIRKISLASRPRPFQNELHIDSQDLSSLCFGLEVLQRETSTVWKQLSAYSLPFKPIRLD